MYVLHLAIDNGLVPFHVEAQFDVPGEHGDDYARKLARAIATAYRDIYGSRVQSTALMETDVTRDLDLDDDPTALERERKLPQLRAGEPGRTP